MRIQLRDVRIGEWVLRTACSQARKWQDEGLANVSVAVNVSAVQFRQEDFCELIRTVLQETGLAPRTRTHRKPPTIQCRRDLISPSEIKGDGVEAGD
jgi:hypothetical protein